MRTLIGLALQDYRKTKRIAPVAMAKDLDINLEHLAQIECGDWPCTREFEHQVLVIYPDFHTAV
jgi:hypothetical protein